MSGRAVDPFGAYNFRVEIGSTSTASFKEMDGLDINTSATEYREGTDSLNQVQIPLVILKNGTNVSDTLKQWRQKVVDEGVSTQTKKNVSIVVEDKAGQVKSRWNLQGAWPSKLDIGSNASVEKLELNYEKITKA